MNIMQIIIIVVLLGVLGVGGYFFMAQQKAHTRAQSLLLDELIFLQQEVVPVLDRAVMEHHEDEELLYLLISAQEQAHDLEAGLYSPIKLKATRAGRVPTADTPIETTPEGETPLRTTPTCEGCVEGCEDCQEPLEGCPECEGLFDDRKE